MATSKKITLDILGGGGEVGASCFQLRMGGQQIVLDAGTHPKKEGREALPEFSLLNRAPDAVLVTHAHVDHCGSVPYLVRQFPQVPVHATVPTARLLDRMLHNSVSVMLTLARERGVRDYPLYDHKDVDLAMARMPTHEFDTPFRTDRDGGVRASFHYAGHVLGCASVLLQSAEHTVFYTSDVCEARQELLDGRRPLNKNTEVDTLIIESTHGATDDFPSYEAETNRLAKAISGVLRGGGVALVPSFALGRTQEMVNILARLQEEGRIPEVPIYASGMGRAVYEIYLRFSRFLHPEAVLRPLDRFGRIGNAWDPDVVDTLLSRPAILVATSGMMLPNTPSALIAEALVQQNHHGIFFVGYLDHDTLGYHLLHAEPGQFLQFGLGRRPVEIKLENIKRFHFSAHAPRDALHGIIDRIAPKNVVYVHGDAEALAWMKTHTANGYRGYAPELGQSITLEA